MYDWLATSGILDTESYAIYDGAHVQENCTDINKAQFSFPAALTSLGVAFLYNTVSTL